MNSSREEQMMWADAARVHEEADADSGGVAIRRAVQSGVDQGGWHSWQSRLNRGSFFALAAAALVAVILFFVPLLQDSAPRTAAPRAAVHWGELEKFKRLSSFNKVAATLDSAIRHDYIQLINQSAETEGYRITVNAVTADENRIILLYTAKVTEEQEIYGVSSARLKDLATGYYLDHEDGIGGHDARTGPEGNRIWYGQEIIHLDRSKPFPGKLEADFQIASVDPGKLDDPKRGTIVADMHYSSRLKLSFKLDSKFKQQATRIIEPKEDFMLDGIEVTLMKVELSPLVIRTEIEIKHAADTTWQNRQKIMLDTYGEEVQSTTREGTVRLPMTAGPGNYAGFEQRFGSTLLDQPESLNLMMTSGQGKEMQEINIPLLP